MHCLGKNCNNCDIGEYGWIGLIYVDRRKEKETKTVQVDDLEFDESSEDKSEDQTTSESSYSTPPKKSRASK